MNDDSDTFTTESSPGEQASESTPDDAVAFFEAAFVTTGNWYGPRASGILQSSVRTALATDGMVSPEKVARTARKLDEDDAFGANAPVESILRRLEAMIGERNSDTPTSTGEI